MWWRVWVLWRDSRVLHRALAYICGGVLLAATFSEPQLSPFFPSDLCARLMSRRVCSHGGHRHELFMQGAGRVYVRGPARGQCRVDALARDEPRCYDSYRLQGVVRFGILSSTTPEVLPSCSNFSRVHRRCIRRHVASGSHNTQVESIFALLVESGALYGALWVRTHSILQYHMHIAPL